MAVQPRDVLRGRAPPSAASRALDSGAAPGYALGMPIARRQAEEREQPHPADSPPPDRGGPALRPRPGLEGPGRPGGPRGDRRRPRGAGARLAAAPGVRRGQPAPQAQCLPGSRREDRPGRPPARAGPLREHPGGVGCRGASLPRRARAAAPAARPGDRPGRAARDSRQRGRRRDGTGAAAGGRRRPSHWRGLPPRARPHAGRAAGPGPRGVRAERRARQGLRGGRRRPRLGRAGRQAGPAARAPARPRRGLRAYEVEAGVDGRLQPTLGTRQVEARTSAEALRAVPARRFAAGLGPGKRDVLLSAIALDDPGDYSYAAYRVHPRERRAGRGRPAPPEPADRAGTVGAGRGPAASRAGNPLRRRPFARAIPPGPRGAGRGPRRASGPSR